jgi:Winged helix DNA-binding domain
VARVRTAVQAAKWIDHTGIALLFPKADVVLPSLWEAVNGDRSTQWAVRDADGAFIGWTEEMGIAWGLKDELPDRRLACVGKHLAGVATCIAPQTLPALYALTGRSGRPEDFRGAAEGLELEVCEAVLDLGPLTAPALRETLGAAKKDVDRAVLRLQRALVLTNAGVVEQERGWPAIAVDLLARRFELGSLPTEADARRSLARLVLMAAGEVTAADLAGALGWRRKQAEAVLDEVATSRDGGGFRIWTRD